MPDRKDETKCAAVIGGGPAGLMAAERLAMAGARVTVYERMPSLARKLLMAGRGGLNITHGEAFDVFMKRYGDASRHLYRAIEAFPPTALRKWCAELGEETFVGSSGRVFPESMKASPLLRAWLKRLATQGVEVKLRHVFRGWAENGDLEFEHAGALTRVHADAVVLAMGGASWPRLGSDGGWTDLLRARGVEIAALRPANCGFEAAWSEHLRTRFAGGPLKNVALRFGGQSVRGECVISDYGLEGGAIYAMSASLRDAIENDGSALLHVDLRPDTTVEALAAKFSASRGKESLSNFLRKRAGLSPAEIALLHETHVPFEDTGKLAAHIKALPIELLRPRPIERAISTAGGIAFAELDEHHMLKKLPGVFCAGEMLDWEAPTGGYLLQACMATGAAAGEGAAQWLAAQASLR